MIVRSATLGTVLLLVAAAAYWAGTNAMAPPSLPDVDLAAQTYKAEVGAVARSIRLPLIARWETSRTLKTGRGGTVTSVRPSSMDPVAPGAQFATIDLQPVIVLPGVTPMFRDLTEGTRGPDVRQLQAALVAAGFDPGPLDGRFGRRTKAATQDWQRSVGATADGAVERGAVLFLDGLPLRMELLVGVGDQVAPGDDLARVLPPSPEFVATATASQRAELSTGMSIVVTGPAGEKWAGVLSEFNQLDDGRTEIRIDGDVCGSCSSVPYTGDTALSGAVEIVARTEGTLVPESAIELQADGSTAVILADGTRLEVRIVAEADGLAVVDGLEPGTDIRLPTPPG